MFAIAAAARDKVGPRDYRIWLRFAQWREKRKRLFTPVFTNKRLAIRCSGLLISKPVGAFFCDVLAKCLREKREPGGFAAGCAVLGVRIISRRLSPGCLPAAATASTKKSNLRRREITPRYKAAEHEGPVVPSSDIGIGARELGGRREAGGAAQQLGAVDLRDLGAILPCYRLARDMRRRRSFARVAKDSGARQKIRRGENCLLAIEVQVREAGGRRAEDDADVLLLAVEIAWCIFGTDAESMPCVDDRTFLPVGIGTTAKPRRI